MPCNHGKGFRLDIPNVDLEQFDDDGEATRVGLLNGFLGPGKFGRMFPDSEKFRPDDADLTELAQVMRDNAPQDPSGDSQIPGGITYLGQFIDHDITGDKTAGFPEIDDVATIEQARSPSLDLDSVYGMGPQMQPELYDPAFPPDRARFLIGKTSPKPSLLGIGLGDAPTLLAHDLPRGPDSTALIGDGRNEENLVIAQTHLAFLKFHNAVMDVTPGPEAPPAGGYDSCCYSRPDGGDTLFHRAQRIVRFHYQWIVLHEFLESIIDPAVLQDVLDNGLKFYELKDGKPYMPVEFSVAAYRFGHSMIRENYGWNRTFNNAGSPALTAAVFKLLFAFTRGGGFQPSGDGTLADTALPSNWVIDWRRFFDFGAGEALLNKARQMNTLISPMMHALPSPSVAAEAPVSLPDRNLRRGSRVGLPTGQDVADAMGLPKLSAAVLGSGAQGPVVKQLGFDVKTPLWYYVLREAEEGGGERLGAVGSRILAETFVGMLKGSPHSYLSDEPGWTPHLGQAPGSFEMSELITMAGEINVLGVGIEG